MAENKTVETDASVDDFLNGVEPPGRREDALLLRDLMQRLTGVEARMWGAAIVGFGKYQYRHDSGRSGEMLRVGFSPRKANLALYLVARDDEFRTLLDRLGKHKAGASCLYINRWRDVEPEVLEELILRSWRLASSPFGLGD